MLEKEKLNNNKRRLAERSNNNNKRRLAERSKSLEQFFIQKTSEYPELDSSDLLKKFEDQNKQCCFCKTQLECPKLDITLKKGENRYHNNYNQPSLDRIDNFNKLHSIDNINITCWMCNYMRGSSGIELFQMIIDILIGKGDTLDLSNMDFRQTLIASTNNDGKKWNVPPEIVRKQITADNITSLKCPISDLPLFLGKEDRHLLYPSYDRIINNDSEGNKLNHNIDNIQLVASFMNSARNSINTINDFKVIFNAKFPNRTKNIKVIYPVDYKWVLKGKNVMTENRFKEQQEKEKVKKREKVKKHILDKILKKQKQKNMFSPFNKLKKNVKYPHKKLREKFQKIVSQVIRDLRNLKSIKEWQNKHNSIPGYKQVSREELNLYEILSKLKAKKIYNTLLKTIPGCVVKQQKDINNELWKSQWLRVFNNESRTKDLLNWIGTQRKHCKKNKLSKEQILQCEKIPGWWWTEIHQGYNRNKGWFESNPNKLPNKTKHSTEYNWFYKIRKMYIADNLSHFEINLVKNISIFELWLTNGKPLSKKDAFYKEFDNKYKYN